jgi:hypothetical protein
MESKMKDLFNILAAIFGVFAATYLVLRFSPEAIPGLILIIIVLSIVVLKTDKESKDDNK